MRLSAPSVRVGLLVPSSNSVMEPDFYRRLPAEATLHTARMLLRRVVPDEEAIMLDEHALPAARALATVDPHVIVFGCTSASALRGPGGDDAFCDRLQEETGAPIVSVLGAVSAAIERRGARRLGVLTPYVPEVDALLADALAARTSARLVELAGLGLADNREIGRLEPDAIAQAAVERFARRAIDLLFLSCTNLRALEAAPELEERLGVAVVTSNLAALEAVEEILRPRSRHGCDRRRGARG